MVTNPMVKTVKKITQLNKSKTTNLPLKFTHLLIIRTFWGDTACPKTTWTWTKKPRFFWLVKKGVLITPSYTPPKKIHVQLSLALKSLKIMFFWGMFVKERQTSLKSCSQVCPWQTYSWESGSFSFMIWGAWASTQGSSLDVITPCSTWGPGKWEIPRDKPYNTWVLMGFCYPQEPLENTINTTVRGTLKCPLIYRVPGWYPHVSSKYFSTWILVISPKNFCLDLKYLHVLEWISCYGGKCHGGNLKQKISPFKMYVMQSRYCCNG